LPIDFSKYKNKEVQDKKSAADKKVLPTKKDIITIDKPKIIAKTTEKNIKKAELESIHIEILNDDVKILLDGSDKWIMTKLTDKTNKRVYSGNLGMLGAKNYGNMREKEIYKTYADLFANLYQKTLKGAGS